MLNVLSTIRKKEENDKNNNSKVGGLALPNFKTYHNAVEQCGPGIKKDIWNRTERPEINTHIYVQMIFDKGAKISMEKGQSFQQMV